MKKGRKLKLKAALKTVRIKNKKPKGLARALQREKIARDKWRNTLQKLREIKQHSTMKIKKIKQDSKRKIKQAEEHAVKKATLKALRLQDRKNLAKEQALLKAALKFEKKYALKESKILNKLSKGKPGRGRPKKMESAMSAPFKKATKKGRGRPRKHQ